MCNVIYTQYTIKRCRYYSNIYSQTTISRVSLNTAKDCKGTLWARLQEIGTNWNRWLWKHESWSQAETAMEVTHAAGPSWEPALSDSESVRRGRPRHLWTWKFHSTSQSSEVSPLRRWLSELQRAIQAVFSLSCKGMAGTRQSTSTNGNLTVLHRPDAGKKLGSRRRPRADSTMTQIKKRKVWMCPRVWHCTNDEKITKNQKNKIIEKNIAKIMMKAISICFFLKCEEKNGRFALASTSWPSGNAYRYTWLCKKHV